MGKTLSTYEYLQCSLTGDTFSNDIPRRLSPSSQKPLLARYNLDKAKKTMTKDVLKSRRNDMWKYEEILPIFDDHNIVSLGEGNTPFIKMNNLSKLLKIDNLYVKDESNNPTGSFKARGLSAAISKAKEFGIEGIVMPSAGNAAGAMSAYAAKSKMSANVFMPKDAPLANKMECIAFGAKVELVNGFISDAGKASAEAAEKYDLFDISTLKEPFRVEGKKTMGLEIIEQLCWEVPDVIIYPTGGGTGIVGIWKAINELEEMGMIDNKKPKMICVQAEGCSPLVDAFEKDEEYATPFVNPKTLAAGMRVPLAVGDFIILNILKQSNGTAIRINDQEMLEGVSLLSKEEGIFAAPEGGAVLIATKKLRDNGYIKDDDKVVVVNTGSAYKYLDAMQKKFWDD
ncbi:MAG: threonine synthase [Chloroflexi bacterium]|nr:threonine synthase [Chloroflexota bacterium]|tara:strand:+ start:9521 stop:10717 length:1197 start_codon:yes stop_codon:yes gene_type:complete